MTDETCCGACGYPIHATKEMACDWCRQTADRIEALTEQLKTVLDREAATHFRHDAKTDELEAKLEKTVEGLRAFKAFDDMPTKYKRPDVFEVSVRRKLLATLAEIEGEKG